MARQRESRSGSVPDVRSQLSDAFMAYRRSVMDYHQANLGLESARAAGVIEETYRRLSRLAFEVPGLSMPPKPQARNRWHGDDTGYAEWLQSVNDWWIEAETRLSILEEQRDASERKDSPARIPPEHRTIPMTLSKAAKLMGYVEHRGEKDAVEVLSKSIRDGSVKAERQNRQRYVFDRRDFPKESHPKIVPSDKRKSL
jgi:hypothetical protein